MLVRLILNIAIDGLLKQRLLSYKIYKNDNIVMKYNI